MMTLFVGMPMMVFLVLGVEYSNATAIRGQLQDSLDAAMLAVAIADVEGETEQTTFVKQYLQDNFSRPSLLEGVKLKITDIDSVLYGTATIKVGLFFPALLPQDALEIGVDSEVRAEANGLEAMLVLDVTGSMKGDKLTALQTATTNFVDAVFEGEGVKVGLTPFAQYVNIGKANRNWAGFSVPDDYETCKEQTNNITKTTCTGTKTYWTTCYNDGVPYSCKKTEKTGCKTVVTGTETKNVCTQYKFNGCVGSREPPLNVEDSDPDTKIPGLLNVSCNSSTLVRLTETKSTLTDAIKKFSASGSTYIPSGLMMGWHALTPREPLPDGTAYGVEPPPLRAIVLMTDGENTKSKTSKKADHNASSTSAANTVTEDLCKNIKADDIYLVTVAFEVSDDDTKDMLVDCATTPGDAFEADNPEELIDAFADIVGKLSKLRLSQ